MSVILSIICIFYTICWVFFFHSLSFFIFFLSPLCLFFPFLLDFLNIVHLLRKIQTLTQRCWLRSVDHLLQGSSVGGNPLDRDIRDRRNNPICFFQPKLKGENPMWWPSDNLFSLLKLRNLVFFSPLIWDPLFHQLKWLYCCIFFRCLIYMLLENKQGMNYWK